MNESLNMLACDLGASNGRVILGTYNGESINLQAVHKFSNGGIRINNSLYWDILRLFSEIKHGLKKASDLTGGKIKSMAIDTWGVDYGLLDKNNNLISYLYHYRDNRTEGIPESVFEKISRENLYYETGIQFMQINTLFQLIADFKYRPWIKDAAESLLFTPDLLNYFLTGKKYNEQTISSTSEMYNPVKRKWSDIIFKKVNINKNLMQDMVRPGQMIGGLLPEIRTELSLNNNIDVIATGSHDTASAVAATPLENRDGSIYISSGTWSLLGMELEKPVITKKSMEENFTNELGLEDTVRFLKNITGLWLIQECKRIWEMEGREMSYKEISLAASRAEADKFRINPNDPVFLNPDNMPEAIKNYCRRTDQAVPEGIGEVARGIYESLAYSYDEVIDSLEDLVGKKIDTIHMVGGGIKAETLCKYTASITGRQVITGPVEATAMGNMLGQLIALGEIKNIAEGRDLIRNSVELNYYQP